jgi:lipooligosaccharide transport system permease protein
MSELAGALRVLPGLGVRGFDGRRAGALIERSVMCYRRSWVIIVSGFFEPLFYLLSIGVGIGHLVGVITLADGQHVGYASYVAPAMLAAAAMNGAVNDATFNVFWKLKYAKVYDAVLATPIGPLDLAVGEIGWALIRGMLYSAAFLVVMVAMGLVHSWWALAILPCALFEAFAFAAAGMAATTFMRSWQDFDWVTIAILPMFLFSATFYPLSTYPTWLGAIVRWSPLYQGVATIRGLSLGQVSAATIGHLLYLVVVASVGLVVAARRIGKLLLT